MENSIHNLPSLEAVLRHYISLGFYILPVYPKAKAPIGKDHYKSATNDIKKLLKLADENPGCNWGLMPRKSDLVVVDVDAHKGGLEVWDHIKGEVPKTMTARTPRGGLHLIFKAKKDLLYSNPFKDQGVDLQHSNIIVIHPSMNADGVQYAWIDESAIAPLPSHLEEIFARKKGAEQKEPPKLIGAKSFFEKVVVEIKKKELDYHTWLAIGMSLHSAMPTDEGLGLWIEASKGPSWKEGDEALCASKWSGFTASRPDGLSYRSLRFIAKDLGCEVPSLTLEEDKLAFATTRQKIQLEADNNPEWFVDDNGKTVTRHIEKVIEFLNGQGFFVMTDENSGTINRLIIRPDNFKEIHTMKQNDFSNLVDNRFFKTWSQKANGDWVIKYNKISKIWLESQARQEYRKVIFKHKDEKGCLNLWSPLPLAPIKGPRDVCAPVLDLIINGIANGNLEKGLWLIQWLAHIIQRPWERCSLVPVVIGDQGTGKGMLFDNIMKALLEQYHYKIMTARTLKERFNWEQGKRFLTLIDEANWGGDHEEDAILKGLTGSRFQTLEQKFGARLAFENFSRYAILSNNWNAAKIERSNRRYIVFETNPTYREKHDLFAQIANGLEDGALAHYFMDFLLNVSLEGFKPNAMIEFDDGQGHQAKIASNGIEALFWESYFSDPWTKIWFDGKLLKNDAFDAFLGFSKKINTFEKNTTPRKFWSKTYEFFDLKAQPEAKLQVAGMRQRVVEISPSQAAQKFQNTLKLKFDVDFELSEVTFNENEIIAKQQMSD